MGNFMKSILRCVHVHFLSHRFEFLVSWCLDGFKVGFLLHSQSEIAFLCCTTSLFSVSRMLIMLRWLAFNFLIAMVAHPETKICIFDGTQYGTKRQHDFDTESWHHCELTSTTKEWAQDSLKTEKSNYQKPQDQIQE